MSIGLACSLVLWVALVAGGTVVLLRHDGAPGAPGAPALEWPADTALAAPDGRPLLLMLVHPQCPCTRASLDQLGSLLARAGGRVDARLLVFEPSTLPPHWDRSALEAPLAALPGVRRVDDLDGVEAARFGIEVSGHALLYSAEGRLLFSGGLTASRGHRGDSAGLSAASSLLLGRPPACERTAVFGCPIAAPDGGA